MNYQVGEILELWTNEAGEKKEERLFGLFTIETTFTNMGEFYSHKEEADRLDTNAVFYNTAIIEWVGATPYIQFK